MNRAKYNSGIRKKCSGILLAGALLGALAGSVNAQPVSPVGNWDFTISGGRQGVGFLTFNVDNTITGWEAVTRNVRQSSSETDPRGGGGRDGSSSSGSTNKFFIGFTPVAGGWNFDSSGRVVGFFSENEDAADTNSLGSQFSFTGRVNANINRLVLHATESPGPAPLAIAAKKVVWSGVTNAPSATPPSTFYALGSALGTNNHQTFTELLDFLPISSGPAIFGGLASSPFNQNAFFISGNGPGYTNFGVALLSSKKRIAVVLREGDFTGENTVLRAVQGPINTNSFKGKLQGTDDNLATVKYNLQPVTTGP